MPSLKSQQVRDALTALPNNTVTANGTTIPYPFPSPQDWRDHWIYFLLVDRFNNPQQSPQPQAFPCDVYQGGNFEGIKQQIPYLKAMGVGAVWLSPVLINPQWFNNYWGGYGILDFTRIEPRFCINPDNARLDPDMADKEFRELVDAIHAEGMYVIMDIVLNHAGDLFNYEGMADSKPYRESPEYTIYWRNEQGVALGNQTVIENIAVLNEKAGVWPEEFQFNHFFRRKGGNETSGDFGSLKELATDYKDQAGNFPVREMLILAYQYIIAKFDIDGYRIDTLQYIEQDFARIFGNAMREYAQSIGKKNFFTFGEIWQDDDEVKIAEFIGRNTELDTDFIGVDAALDFPMRKRLVQVCKGFAPPAILSTHFDHRRTILKKIISSHGDAGKYFVTFLDNHDLDERFHQSTFAGQTEIALICLMTMQGIPCIYYGTEQGLEGSGNRREYSREALWGKPNAFSTQHTLYILLKELSALRQAEPALRYGRQYFRQCSGNGNDFGYSSFTGGVLAFSRILNDKERLVVVNTSNNETSSLFVVVDKNLHADGAAVKILFAKNVPNNNIGTCETRSGNKVVPLLMPPNSVVILGN